ncbi:MAG: hypothetical protein JRE40_12410 [Deltaproteobacteria bacterium]|nr:hypothetical protein [Deltaproteobacteria bacterium]
MISIHMVGDRVVFYKYKIECQTPRPPETLPEGTTLEETDWGKFHSRLGRYRIEPDGLYADSDAELADIEAGLKELGYAYTVSDIRPTAEQEAKAREIEGWTGSPKEALDYILNNIVPERLAKERELEDLKTRVEALEKKVA